MIEHSRETVSGYGNKNRKENTYGSVELRIMSALLCPGIVTFSYNICIEVVNK